MRDYVTLPFDFTPCFSRLDWIVFLPNYKESSKADKSLRLYCFDALRTERHAEIYSINKLEYFENNNKQNRPICSNQNILVLE